MVGGGAGGLATAGRLARAGLEVTLLEQNAEVGGRMASVVVDGCRWDTGPSLLLFPDKYREAFQALGSTLEEHAEVRRVAPAAYRVFFEGQPAASSLDLLNDPAQMAAQLEGVERGAGAAFLEFRGMARSMLELGVPNFIERDFLRASDAAALAAMIPALKTVNPVDLLGAHDARLRRLFADPRLRAMFTFQDLYVGLSPATAPGVFSLLAGTELTDGVFYPIGGFGRVAAGLRAAAERCGARVRTGARVASIDTDAGGGRVTGVTLAGGERLAADVVVCNRDLPAAYTLLGAAPDEAPSSSGRNRDGNSSGGSSSSGSPSATPAAAYAQQRHDALGRLQYSAAVISYCWKVGRVLDRLSHHNIFLSAEWERSWFPRAATAEALLSHPNFYVACPARTDPSAAPLGCDSVMALLPVANLQEAGGRWDEGLVAAGRQRVLRAFAAAGVGDDVESLIQHELVITPPEWEARYGLRHGAAFGLSHGLAQLSVFRPGTKEPRIQGLYFAGASTRPGNGVPLCLIGAGLTAARVLGDLGLAAAA